MDDIETLARVRGMGFMAGVLSQQSHEPLCSQCISYGLTLGRAREALDELGHSLKGQELPSGFSETFESSSKLIKEAQAPENPVKQRKEGHCKLPDKACFVKKSARMFMFFQKGD